MSRLERLIVGIRRRSHWQVLGIYVVGGWIAFQMVQAITDGIGLSDSSPALALVLFIILPPLVLATAFVQEGVCGAARAGCSLVAECLPFAFALLTPALR